MKKAILAIFTVTALLFAGFYFFGSKKSRTSGYEPLNPEFKEYVAAYTSGYVNSSSRIRVVLQDKSPKAGELNKVMNNNLFRFSPNVEGNIIWLDESTIEFQPKEKMKNGQEYEVTFLLGEALDVKEGLEKFPFTFRIIPQAMDLEITDYRVADKNSNSYNISGTITTADDCDNNLLEKTLKAYYEGTAQNIKWNHENSTTHNFVVQNIKRRDKENATLNLTYNSEPIGAEQTGEVKVEIPAQNVFKIMDVKVRNGGDQQVTVFFSGIPANGQNLNGLFNLSGNREANYSLEGNKLNIFPSLRLEGTRTLELSAELNDVASRKISGLTSYQLTFEELKPEIKFTGEGNIIPSSNQLLLPFSAVNINAVEVKIQKVYEKNILQFLQVNSFSGNNEMRRVGTTVFKKKIDLSTLGSLPKNKWQNYALDLSKLINAEPGAIYNVTMSFRKAYSIYDCQGDTSSVPAGKNEESDADDNEDEKDWDDYSYDYYDYYYDDYYYDYRQRENPCHPAYYSYDKRISRNIMSTNIGLVAKRGNDGSISVMTADLITAEPLRNLKIEAYDFQQMPIGEARTDGNGFAQLKLKKKPFVILASNGNQRTYVKLDDGNSLTTSMFEVEGEEIKKGMKGYLYGERGIWRPGDSLFLTFILENKEQIIPENYPVSMEIINPQGQVHQKITRTKNLDGFYNFSTKTESYSPTGNWMAKVKAGGAVFTKNLRIETIMPNRLKLNLDFKTELLHAYEPLEGDLQINWLHGAPGRNLEAKIDLSLTPGKTEFKGYKDYSFDLPAANFYSESQTIFTGRTNEDGFVKVSAELSNMEGAPGFMNANFTVRGFEEGGAFSTDRFSIPLSPYQEYVGVKIPKAPVNIGYLYTGVDHIVDIVNVDEKGKASAAEVEVKVYKMDWRWWWDDYNDDYSSYMSSEYHTPVQSEVIKLPNGKGKFSFRIDQPEWGRYLVVARNNATGHATGSVMFIDWPAWEGKSPKGNEGANFLGVTTDKTEYNLGEKARIHFPSAEGTRAFVTVENGSRVLKSFWANTSKDSTDSWLEITEDMLPNVYIYVTLIQPHKQTANDLPIRLYGVASIKINDPEKILHPQIATAASWRPETEAVVKVSEKDGKEMTYTLAVVDEGLLDLTRFKTPDPYATFYSKEALGVKTWDIYDNVMGATAGGIQRILSIGGDEGLESKQNPNAQRFVPMVRYTGPFTLKKGETASHKINVPQYVGSVRIMVVAGHDHAFGKEEKTVPVKKPLMILSTLPRVLSPGEEVDLPVTVFAMEDKVKNAKITVYPGNNMEMGDEGSKTITFNRIGDQVVNFRLKVKDITGWTKVRIMAEGAGETTKEEINIEVRSPNPKMSDVKEATMEGGKTFAYEYQPIGIKGTNTAAIEISSIPALNLENRLNYLIEYPHGCIEQTTSAVFAQLYLSKLTDVDEKMKQRISTNVKAAITRIKSFQTSSGGFSYWPGSNNEDDWGTNYAGHFLIEAQKAGYVVPSSLLDGWKNYQKQRAQQWQASKNAFTYHEDLTQAYRLYTLALAGSPELGAMNRLKETKNLSTGGRWRLAAAYVLAGQKETGKKLVLDAKTKVEKYRELGYTYGSSERDEAMILEALTLMKEKSKGFDMLKRVASYLSSEEWMSTQSTAYCLLAISNYASENETGKGINAECKIGKEVVNVSVPKTFKRIEISNPEKLANVSVKNKGNGMLFVRVVRRGVPAAGNETEFTNNISLNVVFKDMNGNPIDVSNLAQGTDFVAEVSVINYSPRGFLNNVALTHLFPSGWEIHNTRLDENSDAFVKGDVPTYQDIRDDRILSYFDIGSGRKKTFRVILNASYTGKFYMPGINVEAMYDNSISAAMKGAWVEVVKGGGKI